MLSFALGELGLRPWEFYEYSFEEYILSCKGYRGYILGEWDRTRHIMFAVLRAGGAKKIRSVEDVLQLPTDKDDDQKVRGSLRERLRQAHENYYGRQQT